MLFFSLALLLLSPNNLEAHGVTWDYSSKDSVGLEFSYDDGTPMLYVEINVYGPDNESLLSQTGRTDKNGYFAFIPETSGNWLVTANDGEGHLARAELTINPKTSQSPEASTGDQASDSQDAQPSTNPNPTFNAQKVAAAAAKPYKIVMIVSIFINIALASMLYKKKKTGAS
jgi:nickel transport protein